MFEGRAVVGEPAAQWKASRAFDRHQLCRQEVRAERLPQRRGGFQEILDVKRLSGIGHADSYGRRSAHQSRQGQHLGRFQLARGKGRRRRFFIFLLQRPRCCSPKQERKRGERDGRVLGVCEPANHPGRPHQPLYRATLAEGSPLDVCVRLLPQRLHARPPLYVRGERRPPVRRRRGPHELCCRGSGLLRIFRPRARGHG
mmetsp:Transcript_102101/g.288343  ORF Transcript_102101/g.288343 Transcript_102101/m.288343 type:complete len:200 (-) Transcript_102101:256-855(-)